MTDPLDGPICGGVRLGRIGQLLSLERRLEIHRDRTFEPALLGLRWAAPLRARYQPFFVLLAFRAGGLSRGALSSGNVRPGASCAEID